MSGINKVIIVGRLGKDPESQTVGSKQVCKFSVATSETWVTNGEKREKVEWHNIVVWEKLAEICSKYLHKGSQVFLEGRLQTRNWEDDSGNKKYMTEIVASTLQFLDSKEDKPESQMEIPV